MHVFDGLSPGLLILELEMPLIYALIQFVVRYVGRSASVRGEARNAAYLSEAADLHDLEMRVHELDSKPAASYQASWMPF